MRRKIAITLVSLLGVLIISFTAVIIYLNSFESDDWRKLITKWVQESTEYELKIDGNVSVEVSLHPRITAEQVNLSSKNTASDSSRIALESIDLRTSLTDLFLGQIVIEHLYLSGLNVDISKNTHKSDDQDRGLNIPVVLHKVEVKKSTITYTDSEGDLLVGSFNSIQLTSKDEGQTLMVDVNGEFQHQRFTISGSIVDPFAIKKPTSFELIGRYLTADLQVKGQTQIVKGAGQTTFNILVNSDNVSQLARQFWRSMPHRPDIAMYKHLELGRGVVSLTVNVDKKVIGMPEFSVAIGDDKSSNKIQMDGSVKDLGTLEALSIDGDIKLQEFSSLSPLIGYQTPELGKVLAKVNISGEKGEISLDKLEATVGDHFFVSGNIKDVMRLETAHVNARANFDDLNQLGFLFGRPLPQLGPVTAKLQLSTAGEHVRFDQIELKIGEVGKEFLILGGKVDNLRDQKGVSVTAHVDLPSLKLLNVKGYTELPDFGPIQGDVKLVDKNGVLAITPIAIKSGVPGNVTFHLNGHWHDPKNLSGADLELKLAAKDLGALGNIFNISGPDKSASVNIHANLKSDEKTLIAKGFMVDIGDSNINGDFYIDLSGKTPAISSTLRSTNIDLDHLGIIEVEADEQSPENIQTEKKQVDSGSEQKSKFVEFLDSEDVIDLSPLALVDLDIGLEAKRIHAAKTDLTNFKTSVALKNGRLQLKPVSFEVGEGRASLAASINSSVSPPEAALELDVAFINWTDLIQPYSNAEMLDGTLDVVADLKGSGDSIGAILDSVGGNLTVLVYDGSVGTRWLNFLADTNIFKAMFGRRKERTPLNCLAVQANPNQGRAEKMILLMDTNRITIAGKGLIDFNNELVDIYLDPKAKGVRLFSIPIPIRVKGPLFNPEVKALGKKSFFKKGTLAVGLSLINPAAWILPYMSTGTGDKHPCAPYIADKKRKKTTAK